LLRYVVIAAILSCVNASFCPRISGLLDYDEFEPLLRLGLAIVYAQEVQIDRGYLIG
jgi:hypothetical protein